MEPQTNRVAYLDIAKAFGMLLVMWGHIHLVGVSNNFVYAFHIPMFFYLSGMVFSPQKYPTFNAFFLRRVKSLLLPYIIYSFVTWLIWVLYVVISHQQVHSIWMPLLETFIARGSEGYLIHNVPLWFVPCLFITELFYFWISKFKDIVIIFIGCIFAIVSYCLVNFVHIFDFTTLPWSIEVSMMALIFYALGHLTIKNIGQDKILQLINDNKLYSYGLALLLFSCVFIIAYMNGSPSMGHARLNNPFLFYTGAIGGIVAAIISSVLYSNITNINHLKKWLLWFGSNSFIAMAIHNPIKGFLIAVMSKITHTSTMHISTSIPYSLCAFALTTITTVLLMIIIVKLTNIVKNYSKKYI